MNTQETRDGKKFTEGMLDEVAIVNALELSPGHVVLDVGCGTGYMSEHFLKAVAPSGMVYALDKDVQLLRRVEEKMVGPNFKAIQGDVTRAIRLDDRSAHRVYVSAVLHMFSKEQVQRFLEEVDRVLKPGGVLAIVEIEKRETPIGPPLNMRFSPEDLKSVVKLPPLGMVKAGDYFYMQLFRKV